MPGTAVVGDRVFVGFVNDQATTAATQSTGWSSLGTDVQGSTTNHRLSVFSRVLDGGANDSLTVTLTDGTNSPTQEANWVVICMTGNGGTPQTVLFTNGASATTGAVTAITGLSSGDYDSIIFLGLDNSVLLSHTVSAPTNWGNVTTSGVSTDPIYASSMDRSQTATTGFSPADVTWTNAEQWITAHVVVLQAPAGPIEKSGSDTATGASTGGVTATVTPAADTATGTESGQVAIPGGDSAVGSETGYVSEEKLGGDTAAGGEAGTTSATVTPPADTATGTETGGTSATLTPPLTETAVGAEQGHIAIPGSDSAVGADAHVPPTQVTVTSGDSAVGSDGGHVETLFGDLIVNLYGIDPDDDSLVPLPDYVSLSFSRQRNDKGAISIDYPLDGLNFDLLRSTVANNRDLEFELWTNGTPTGAMRGYLQEASGDDVVETPTWTFAGSFGEIAMDEVVVYPQDLGELITDPDTGEQEYSNAKRELIVNADNPGEVMTLIIEQAQDRGTLPDLELDFTTLNDSGGNAWAGVLTATYSPGVTYTQILNAMVDLHLCEWAVEWNGTAHVLRVWNAEGRGADLTLGPRPVTLRRGKNLLDAPRKWSVRDAGTTMLAAGQEGIYDDWSDATALARRGRRIEKFATLGNASDEEAVLAFAQAELATNAPGTLTVDHGIGMLPGEARPIIAFDIGDWVYSQVGLITERLRVVQWEVSIDSNRELTGKVALNDTIQDAIERLRERLNAIQSGEAVIGTSEPGPQVEDRTPPAAPEGVAATSIAYQDPDHGAGQTLAMVTVGWLPVTTNADGADSPLVQAAVYILDKIEDEIANPPDPEDEDATPFDPATWTWEDCPQLVQDFAAPLRAIWVEDGSPDTATWLAEYIAEWTAVPTAAQDVAGYNVRYSYLGLEQVGGIPSSDPFPEDTRVYYEATPPEGITGTIISFGGIEGGSRLRIEVRAFDNNANFGAWTSISHDSANDATPPPVPAGPDGFKAWFRTLDIPWNGLGSEGEPMPIDFFYVRVWVGQGSDMTLPAEPVGETVQFDPLETAPQYVAQLFGAGTWNLPDVPLGVGWYARLQAVDYTGNASAGSTIAGPIFVEQLVSQDLIDDIITANLLGPDSVESVHIVNGAITSAKIVDAAIVNAKIANLAVNDAKIDTLSVGKITTGTLFATVTVSGSLWTSLDTNATRLGFSSAGLQLYRTNSPSGGSTLVGEWRTSDGGMLVTGTFQSALSNQRIHIDPDGSMRFYPTSGTNYSRITNEGNDVVWRGPLDGSSRSGRVNVNTLGVGINFSAESEILSPRSEILLVDRRMRFTAPFVALEINEDLTNPVGGIHRFQLNHIDSSGNPQAYLNYVREGNEPIWMGNNAGLRFASPAALEARLGPDYSDWINMHADNFVVESSRTVKRDIEDIRAALDPLHTIRAARARTFVKETSASDAPQVGVIAEELPEILINRDAGTPGVGLGQLIGVLWGAFNQSLDQEIVATSSAIVASVVDFAPGDTVEVSTSWDSKPPAAPTGGFVQVHSDGIAGWIKTSSVTATGCVVVLKNISHDAIEFNEINATAIGLGLFSPPYNPPEK